MFAYRTRGVAMTLGALTLVACSDPLQRTDLRPDGPPEVLAVLVSNDPANSLSEGATFCKVNDDKRPTLVGLPDGTVHTICDVDMAKPADEIVDAAPQGWYVRVEFDELLNADVEEIVPILDENGIDTGTFSGTIANTRPVRLQCQSVTGNALVDVAYDGYYSPAGNNVTWPLGPSLVIKPNDPTEIGSGRECQVTLKDSIVDKDGNPVPVDQRGPFKFKLAPIQVIAIAPADGTKIDAEAGGAPNGVDLTFNTGIDTSVWPDIGGAPCLTDPAQCFGLYDPSSTFTFTPTIANQYIAPVADNEIFVTGDLPVGGDFTFAFKPGAKLRDLCGVETTFAAPSVADNTQVQFTTNPLKLVAIAPFDTAPNAPPASKIKLDFNQTMDYTSLATTDVTVTPTVPGLAVTYDPADASKLVVTGNYASNTDYTFTLKMGTTIDDCPGAENHPAIGLGFGPCVKSATYTAAADQVIHFHTAAIALTAITPKDNGTIVKTSPTGTAKISLTFNQTMDPTSLTSADYTIDPAIPLITSVTPSSTLSLTSAASAPAGMYTFTLKAGAVINDVLGTAYTVAADKVIHFTVKNPSTTPPPPPHRCL